MCGGGGGYILGKSLASTRFVESEDEAVLTVAGEGSSRSEGL